MDISSIKIGERARKDMGDLRALAHSIARHGLLHPVVVKSDGTLVAGHRRIEAVKLIGWTEIPATVIDVADLLSAERDENTERKDFTRSEAVAIASMIEEQERPAALARMRAGKPYGKVTEGPVCVADIAAEAVGMSRPTYQRAKEVIDAGRAEPEKFGDLTVKMDETGNVGGALRELRRRRAGKPEEGRRGFRKDTTAPFVITKQRHREVANKSKQRMIDALSQITGLCRGLSELDVAAALAVCDAEEITTWTNKTQELAAILRKFAHSLRGTNGNKESPALQAA